MGFILPVITGLRFGVASMWKAVVLWVMSAAADIPVGDLTVYNVVKV